MASSSARRPAASDDALLRQKAITSELNHIPLRDVMEGHFGFQSKKGGRNMVKYEISPGFYLNCSTTDNWFASFNGAPISGSGSGRTSSGGTGAINAIIAVRAILGEKCEFKDARRELQRAFAPHTLDAGYAPAGHIPVSRPIATPPAEEKERPFGLPARFDSIDDYLRSARARGPQPVLKLPDSLDRHVRHYLTEMRKLPESAVGDLMARNAAYPSVRERHLTSRRTGTPYVLAEPVVVFPLVSWREKFVIGYDYKTLPTEPEFASFAATEGRKKFGGFVVGHWGDTTREVILTEGALDTVSKWALEQPGPETCIWGMSGARTSEILFRECRRRDIEVRAAFDNDRAGRTAAQAALRMAEELGVRCSAEFVQPSEIDFALTRDADGDQRLDELESLCADRKIPWRKELEPHASDHRGVVANVQAAWDFFIHFANDDQLKRMTADLAGEPPPFAPPRLQLEVRNKDWNDQLKNEFTPRLEPTVNFAAGPIVPHVIVAEMEITP